MSQNCVGTAEIGTSLVPEWAKLLPVTAGIPYGHQFMLQLLHLQSSYWPGKSSGRHAKSLASVTHVEDLEECLWP